MRAVVLVGLFAVGCGDPEMTAGDDAAPPPPGDILAQLAALPGVTATEWTPPAGFVPLDGYRYIDLEIAQPIDHEHPELGTFEQYAALMWTGRPAALVMYTTGYNAGWTRNLTEPAQLLGANQLSLEYRFYGTSHPATVDWTKLTVHQNMADEHAILQLLKPLYLGATVQTGASKGGEDTLQHASLYPGDLDVAVAYVAPVITAKPDLRYATILDDIGIPACRTALRALQREMLVRRTAMEQRASATDLYAIAGVAHATETSIVELEFAFWMTRGENDCNLVPATTASDAALYLFLNATSGPSGYDDASLRESGGQYIYQDQAELGYPIWEHQHLDDLMAFDYEDWSAYMPAVPPAYDPAVPVALAAWAGAAPQHVMFLGGEWDPWGAGYPVLGSDVVHLTVAHGSHWSTSIFNLATADRDTAIATLQKWADAATTHALVRPPASLAVRLPIDRLR